jgi:cob(I)alamin adenosyltransferase
LEQSGSHVSDPVKTPHVGLVTVFTGEGKGKTSAAIGTAVRAAGYGLRVFVVFFFKGKMFTQGEVTSLASLPSVKTAGFGTSTWVRKGAATAEAVEQAHKALEAGVKAVTGGQYDVVILDEINSAADFGLIKVEDVEQLISSRPSGVDLILTGRGASKKIIDMADTVTEMVNVKHAYDKGIPARGGIDY